MNEFQELLKQEMERIRSIEAAANTDSLESITLTLKLMKGIEFAKFNIDGVQTLVRMAKKKLNENLPRNIYIVEEGLMSMSLCLCMNDKKMGSFDLINNSFRFSYADSTIDIIENQIKELEAEIARLKPQRLDFMLHGEEEEEIVKKIKEKYKKMKENKEKQKELLENKIFIENNVLPFTPFAFM